MFIACYGHTNMLYMFCSAAVSYLVKTGDPLQQKGLESVTITEH